MDINELETYRLSDAVKFHDRLNPVIWGSDEIMLPEVRDRLLAIANDFREFLGIDVEVKDITVSGSNAAYTYTPHSDIDLHLVIDLPKADQSEVYRELFDAKKYAYNDQHDFKIGGYDVELYVQNANDVHHSQGIYSLLDNDWVRVPSRRQPTINDISVESKYQDLAQRIDAAIQSQDLDRMDALAAKIRDMRQAGLDKTGEFGAENLAFKVLRNNGTLERLRDARRAAKDQLMSLEERKKKKSKKKVRYAYGGYWFPGYHYYGQTDTATDGGDGGGESVKESTESQSDIIKRFARSCADFLGMETMPELKLRRDPEWTHRNGTFGRYTADPEHRIELATNGRHIIDILRTLAHEMTHARQNEVTGLPDDAGETGSEYEDSANAMAGRIMRHWAQQEPQMFKGIDLGEDSTDHPGDQPAGAGVLGALRTIQNIGRAAKNLPTQAGAQEELSQELRNWLRRQGGQTDQPSNLPLPDIRQQQESQDVTERRGPIIYTNNQLDQIAVRYAQQYRVPIDLVRHVMQKETGGLPADLRATARSPKGAIGVMQLMPATAAELGVDPRDPVQNIEGGVRYLRQQLDAFGGNHQLAMMAYNWGPGNVRRWRQRGSDPRRMPRETRKYIAGYSGSGPRTQVARAPQKPSAAPGTRPTPPTERGISAQDKQQTDIERLRQQELARIEKILQRDLGKSARPATSDDMETYPRRATPQRSAPPQRRKEVWEASGYIPTEKEKNDPRFSMALTVDIHPGQTGKEANKLGLKTDSQGRPALLMKKLNNLLESMKANEDCWDGYRQQGMKRKGDRMVPNCVKVAEQEDQELLEVDMSPGALKKWAQSDAAQKIRVGFEFEMYFPDTADADRDSDGDFDYAMDEEANSISDIVEFFSGGNNPTSRGVLNRLEEGLYETFAEWRQDQIANEASSSGFYDYMEENEPDLREDKIEEFRQEARSELGDEASEEAVDERTQDLYAEWVDDQYSSGGLYYDDYMEWLSDSLGDSYDESEWLRSEMRYMSDVAQEEDLEWPWINEVTGGGHSPEKWARELEGVIGMPVQTGSYHGSQRGEDHANLEPDGSLSEPDSDQDAGLELITPYRPLPEAMKILDRVIKWADDNGIYTNSSTGLHMNVSIEDVKNVDWVKLVLFLGDRYILDQFDRRYRMYASSSLDRIESKIRDARPVQEEDGDQAIYGGRVDIEKALQMMRNNSIELARQAIQSGGGREKYQSVHVKELRDGGSYIEFRGPGNDWLQKAQETERGLADTVYRLGRAMTIAADPEAERQEYARKLYKILTPEDPNKKTSMKLFADYSAGVISKEELKRAWAEQVLRAQRRGRDRDAEAEYDVVDRDTGEVIDTFTAVGDNQAIEKARDRVPAGTNYDVRLHDREAALSPKERRRGELALRVAAKPIWWRVSTKDNNLSGYLKARTASKAIDNFMQQNPEAMRVSRDRFEARPDEPPPLEQTPLPDELKDREWYADRVRGVDKNWALVDRDGEIRYRFQAADQEAALDRLRSYQAENPERKNNRWLVPLLPPKAESDARPRVDLGDTDFRVTWQETRSVDGEVSTVSPSMTVTAPTAEDAVDRVRNALNAAGRGPYNLRAEPISSNAPSAVDLNALPPGESDFMVSWDEFRTHEGREVRVTDGVRVTARNAAEASRRVHDSLQMQGREAFNVNAEPTDPPRWRRNRDVPAAATDNITNPLHQTTGEWTGRWLVQSTVTGETVHTISGIGNVQDDANRHAERWVRSTGFDDPIEVVPELQ